MGFHQQSVWIKSSFVLITIGFAVWLSAGMILDSSTLDSSNSSRYQAFIAFMIIGVVAYYIAVLLNYLLIFVPDTEGNAIVLFVGAATSILAGLSGIIAASLGGYITFSDRLAWSMVCAFVGAAFLIISAVCGGGGGGGAGSSSAAAHRADFQPQQAA